MLVEACSFDDGGAFVGAIGAAWESDPANVTEDPGAAGEEKGDDGGDLLDQFIRRGEVCSGTMVPGRGSTGLGRLRRGEYGGLLTAVSRPPSGGGMRGHALAGEVLARFLSSLVFPWGNPVRDQGRWR